METINQLKKTDTYTIAKKKVIANVTAKDKVYDGKKDATVSATVETGIAGEALAITGLTGTFDDANADEGKTVTIDSSEAVVTAAEESDKTNVANYEVSYPATATANIAKANMSGEIEVDADCLNKAYDGKAVKNPSVTRPAGSSVMYEYYKVDEEAGTQEKLESAPKDAGTYKVKVIVTKANYNDVVVEKDFTIAKSSEVKSPDTDTVKAVAETIKGKKDGQITGLDDTMEYSTDGGETYIPVETEQTTLSDLPAGTYFVRYKETANYNASEAIELTIADGKQLNVTLPETSNGEYTITAEPSKVDYDGSTTVIVTLTDGCEVTKDFKLVAAYKDEEGQTQKVTYKGVQDPDDASKYTFTIDKIETDLALSIPTGGVQDVEAPTATVTVDNIAWKQFLSNVTFGRFFKESKTVTIETTDNCGTDNVTVEYYLSDKALTEDQAKGNDITWTAYSEAITLEQNSKKIVYVKVTDKAGNVTVVNSDGIVVYTDSTADETKLEFIKDVSTNDLTATVTLNGNTIKDISVTEKAGTDEEKTTTLTEGEEYTIKTDAQTGVATITFKNDYLKTLAVGSYTFTTTYNPFGEEYKAVDGNEAPAATTVALAVKEQITDDLFDFAAPKNLSYDGTAKEATVKAGDDAVAQKLGQITVHYYDSEGNEVTGPNGVLAAPTNVGTYTVTIDVADSDTYKGVTGLTNKDWTFTIVQGTNPSTPSKDEVKATAETVKGKADGKITGVNDTMEYSTDGGKTYKSIDKGVTELTNLAAGTYSIRYKETASYKASEAIEVTVAQGKTLTTADIFDFEAPTNLAYDGTAKEATVKADDDAVAKQLGKVTVHYYDSEGNEVIDKDGNVAAPTNVGTYTVKIDVAESDTYKGATGLTNKDWTFTIVQGTNPSTPSKDDVKAVAETVQGKADGKITGVNDTMEYSTDGGKTYNAIPEGTTELTSLAAGTYSIRYKETANYKASDAIEVTVEEGVPAVATKVTLNTTSKTLTGIGKTKQLKATATPSNAADKEIVWTSSNPNVATVDANGKVTAVGNGTATITATVKNGTAKATCKVKVNTSTEKTKTQLTLSKKLKALPSGNNVKASWGKVSGADGYYVYAQYCGSDFTTTPTATIKGNETTSVTVKKINKKAIDKTKVYKFYVAAYKTVNGKNIVIGKSICSHIAGANNKKYTNPNKVTTTKSSYSLKAGKTAQIKASQTLVNAKKKALTDSHASMFRYASSDKSVATVNWTTGKITAVAKGTCKVYVYARNGYTKTISVTVK